MTIQSPVPLPTLPPAPAPPRRTNTWRIVVGVVAAVVLVVVVGVVLLNRASKPAAPTGLRLLGKTAVTVTIGWQPGGSKAPSAYAVYRDGARIHTVTGTVTQYRDSGLRPSSTYRYQVTASTSGHESAKSAALTVTTSPASLASASLVGSYDVRLRITSENGYTNLAAGHVEDVSWSFTPAAGGLTRLSGSSWQGDGWVMTLNHAGRTFSGHGTEALSKCFLKSVETRVSTTLTVAAAASVGDYWTGTRFTGTLTQVAPRTVSGPYVCPGAQFTATVTGTLHQ